MLAQLVEHVTFNDVADGSNPSQDTIYIDINFSFIKENLIFLIRKCTYGT